MPTEVKFDTRNALRVLRRIRNEDALREQAARSGQRILSLFQSHTPAAEDGGDLRAGWSFDLKVTSNKATLRFPNTAKNAPQIFDWLTTGTRPHTIKPRRSRVLTFSVKDRIQFARIVRHPGTKPSALWLSLQPPLQTALNELQEGVSSSYLK